MWYAIQPRLLHQAPEEQQSARQNRLDMTANNLWDNWVLL